MKLLWRDVTTRADLARGPGCRTYRAAAGKITLEATNAFPGYPRRWVGWVKPITASLLLDATDAEGARAEVVERARAILAAINAELN